MNSFQYKKNEFKKLCAIIGFKRIEVEKLLDKIDTYYDEWIEQKTDKKTGDLKKYKDGRIKYRIIRPSQKELKLIQANIKNKLLVQINLPDCVHGGVRKKSNISNAKPHQGNDYLFTTDLKEFYPNINPESVYNTFVGLNFSPHFAHWLTKLTTWKHQLPQGTPTSPHIANLVFRKTDFKLIHFCNSCGIRYTRYVDDLTFSAHHDFRPQLNKILKIITDDGYKLNYRKTKYSGNQTITGIKVFLNKIDAPETIIQKAKRETEEKTAFTPYTNYLNNIRKTNRIKTTKSI